MNKKKKAYRFFINQGLYLMIFMICTPLILSWLNLYISSDFKNYRLSIFAFTLPYFFILNLFLIIGLLLKKRYKMLILPLISMILTWNLAQKSFAFSGLFPRDNDHQNKSLTVLTWNVAMQGVYAGHPDRAKLQDSMIQTINEQNPDVICLQEFVSKDDDSSRSTINDLYTIIEALGMPHYFYGFVPGVKVSGNHFGKIILSKYPIIYEQHINFDSIKYNNSFEYVDIVKDADTMRIATFHLQSLSLQGKAREITEDPVKMGNGDTLLAYSKSIYAQILSKYGNRVKQASAVHELVSSTSLPIIVCGDMNDVPASYAYTLFCENLSDAFLSSGIGLGKTFRSSIPNLRIDYIFYTPEIFQSEYTRVVKVPFSDHYPVVTKLSY